MHTLGRRLVTNSVCLNMHVYIQCTTYTHDIHLPNKGKPETLQRPVDSAQLHDIVHVRARKRILFRPSLNSLNY